MKFVSQLTVLIKWPANEIEKKDTRHYKWRLWVQGYDIWQTQPRKS